MELNDLNQAPLNDLISPLRQIADMPNKVVL